MAARKRTKPVVYRARDGFHISDEQASAIGVFCERLVQKFGVATAENFVSEAKRDRTVRRLIDWDDASAAESWRLYQARVLMASFAVVVERDDREVVVRGMQFIDEAGGYVPARQVFASSSMTDHVLEKAKREAIAWFHRYRSLQAFAGVGPVVDAIEKHLASLEDEPAASVKQPTTRKRRRAA